MNQSTQNLRLPAMTGPPDATLFMIILHFGAAVYVVARSSRASSSIMHRYFNYGYSDPACELL